jgi:hypothetical protein
MPKQTSRVEIPARMFIFEQKRHAEMPLKTNTFWYHFNHNMLKISKHLIRAQLIQLVTVDFALVWTFSSKAKIFGLYLR